jgi:hypothetical protein
LSAPVSGLTIARYIGAIATIWVLMVGLNPALRLSLKGYFKPFNFAIIWEVMGIGIGQYRIGSVQWR